MKQRSVFGVQLIDSLSIAMLTSLLRTLGSLIAIVITTQGASAIQDGAEA